MARGLSRQRFSEGSGVGLGLGQSRGRTPVQVGRLTPVDEPQQVVCLGPGLSFLRHWQRLG